MRVVLTPARHRQRTAATTVEAAVVMPVLLLLVFGLIFGGLAVFQYSQVACMAEEAARYASVRGSQYSLDTYQTPPTTQQIISQAVYPLAAGMETSQLNVTVQWIDNGSNTTWNWDAAPKTMRSITATGVYVTNTVQVTVSYQTNPGPYWPTLTVTSVCAMPMTN